MQKNELSLNQPTQMKRLVAIPVLAAVAFILQALEIPLPFFPTFLKLDFSTLPGIFAGLVFGPVAGIMVELLKNGLHLLLKNTDGLLIGELANFIAGACFIYLTVTMQRLGKGRGSLIAGFALGTVLMTVFMSVANYFVMIPAYAVLYQMPVEKLLEMFQMDSLWSLIVYGIAPFNIVKGVLVSILAFLIYVKIEPRIKHMGE
ncbi:ECF transporter S component [Brevibacillus fluminis]|uniref:Riboflavin transporter n=1 Tax=Brevibacillus fluminis TaxID=511487 RepID=A0A3M8DVR0_9BACL|nr:ECF transporter S component [Brevibacillus fluminis]RNB92250.1 ECF transporter S component [Brevibacillus fluminis]